MSKVYTKLNIGDVVAASGNKCFKTLTTEVPSGEITDLTGTTWYVPSGWSATAGYGDFEISGEIITASPTFKSQFTRLIFGSTYQGYDSENGINVGNNNSYTGIGNNRNLTLTFTGGTDATNPDLISWLYANGELQ